MKNKRGSHVGFAISFMLFISFVIFLFSILGPVGKVESDKDFLLKHLENEIIENTTAELTIISVKPQSGNCTVPGGTGLENYIVKNLGEIIKIYNSNELFNTEQTTCTEGSIPQNDVGLIRTNNYVFETKILELKEKNYDTLKEDFNIPDINDFKINFTYSNATEIEIQGIKEIPPTDVFAELIPVTYVDKDANIEIGYFKVIVW